MRIAMGGSSSHRQFLAIAKHIISKQIQRPVSEMIAMETPNGDIAVRAKNLTLQKEKKINK